jgi:16S rRNA processing protein RimM
MDAQGFVPLGRIARTHGLNGEVSVVMTADLPVTCLEGLAVWFVPPPATVRSARVTTVRPGPKGPLVAFEGVTDIDAASALRGATILCRAEDVPEYEEEFDPVGMTVTDVSRGPLGEVVDVIVTGANDVWVVEGGPFGQVLVPAIDGVVGEIDEGDATITVQLLPGLIEDE